MVLFGYLAVINTNQLLIALAWVDKTDAQIGSKGEMADIKIRA
ncbi:hypothetical protein [Pseudidiomarina aquimaris]|nr:hypothetical protein [Pseudidiomarina aquimaris]